MGRVTQWHVPGRVYVTQRWGAVSLEELNANSKESMEMIRSGQPPVHCIVDMRYITSWPRNLSQIQKADMVIQAPNLGWVLILTNNQFISFAASIFTQLKNIKQHTYRDPVEMIQNLQRLDPTLPELPPYIFEPPESD